MSEENFTNETPIKSIRSSSLWGGRVIENDTQEIKITTKHWIVGKRIRRYRLDEINPRYEIRRLNFAQSGQYSLIAMILIFMLLLAYNVNLIMTIIVMFLIFVLPKWIMKEQIIEFKTRDEPIWIYSHKWNEAKVLEFTDNLVVAVKNYFISKYGFIDTDIPKEIQFENYRWLLQNDFISEHRYLALKSKLKKALEK